jgi:hypothetical protein
MTHIRYISSFAENINFDFLSKFRVAKLNKNGKPDSMVIDLTFIG